MGSQNGISAGKRHVTLDPGFSSRAVGAVECLERRTVWGIATGSTSKDTWATNKPPQALEYLLDAGVKVGCLRCRLPSMLIHTRFLPFSSAGELGVVLFAGLGVPGILRRLKGVSAPTSRDCGSQTQWR